LAKKGNINVHPAIDTIIALISISPGFARYPQIAIDCLNENYRNLIGTLCDVPEQNWYTDQFSKKAYIKSVVVKSGLDVLSIVTFGLFSFVLFIFTIAPVYVDNFDPLVGTVVGAVVVTGRVKNIGDTHNKFITSLQELNEEYINAWRTNKAVVDAYATGYTELYCNKVHFFPTFEEVFANRTILSFTDVGLEIASNLLFVLALVIAQLLLADFFNIHTKEDYISMWHDLKKLYLKVSEYILRTRKEFKRPKVLKGPKELLRKKMFFYFFF
jgi:hypothetical protein